MSLHMLIGHSVSFNPFLMIGYSGLMAVGVPTVGFPSGARKHPSGLPECVFSRVGACSACDGFSCSGSRIWCLESPKELLSCVGCESPPLTTDLRGPGSHLLWGLQEREGSAHAGQASEG